MYRKDTDLDWRINQAISPADYTPVTGTRSRARTACSDTATTAARSTFYELAARQARAVAELHHDAPRFRAVNTAASKCTLHRRLVNQWQAVDRSRSGCSEENYGAGSFQNPQVLLDEPGGQTVCGLVDQLDGTRIAGSTPYIGKLMGSYQLPYNLTVSGFYQFTSGTHFTRTVNSHERARTQPLNQGNVACWRARRNEESFDAAEPARSARGLRGALVGRADVAAVRSVQPA